MGQSSPQTRKKLTWQQKPNQTKPPPPPPPPTTTTTKTHTKKTQQQQQQQTNQKPTKTNKKTITTQQQSTVEQLTTASFRKGRQLQYVRACQRFEPQGRRFTNFHYYYESPSTQATDLNNHVRAKEISAAEILQPACKVCDLWRTNGRWLPIRRQV